MSKETTEKPSCRETLQKMIDALDREDGDAYWSLFDNLMTIHEVAIKEAVHKP